MRMHSELEEGQTMVNPLQLGSMLVDWMDPEKAVYVSPSNVFDDPFTFSQRSAWPEEGR